MISRIGMAAMLGLLVSGGVGQASAAGFESCLAGLKQAAREAGVSAAVIAEALDDAVPDERVLALSQVQPEFKLPIWDYFGFLVDEQRVSDGQAMMARYERELRAAEEQFGIDRHVIAAIWGRRPSTLGWSTLRRGGPFVGSRIMHHIWRPCSLWMREPFGTCFSM